MLSNDAWSILDKKRIYAATLCGSSTVTKMICILRFKILDEKLKRSCILFRDSMEAEQYRQLLVSMRNNKTKDNSNAIIFFNKTRKNH